MMETWKKMLIFFVIVIPIVIVLTLLAINYNGWGASLSTSTVPFTKGLHELGSKIPSMMLENGYIMLLVYLSVPALMFGFALLYWNKDWGYKLQPENHNNTGNYQSSPSQNMIPLDSGMQSQPKGE